MYLESKSSAKSEEFLNNLIDKRVLIVFKDGTDVIGTLIWDDKHAIGVKFLILDTKSWEETVLYYKSFIKSIREKIKK
ncbi:MAG: hypothetical protein KAW92_11715 [Candidatus Cloacimonetes bacterium]|nr:hypothetical protein [Candidatus Cloacimonadota bacterium]